MIAGQLDIFDLIETDKPTVIPLDALKPVIDAGTFHHPGTPEALEEKLLAFREDHKKRGFRWKTYVGWATYYETSGVGSDHKSAKFSSILHCPHNVEDWCSCVKWHVSRVYCAGCNWWSGIHVSTSDAVHEYLDHCWPGWRDLPVLEGKTVGYQKKFNLPADYPKEFMVTGAPLLDCRGNSRTATRDVPGGNQFGGYQVAMSQDCEQHNQKGRSDRSTASALFPTPHLPRPLLQESLGTRQTHSQTTPSRNHRRKKNSRRTCPILRTRRRLALDQAS